ncbi:DUF4279 domain-containing protein [Enterococcus sp. CWB-B31]|uniref:DUF4279 domain-containing protein n=1 Tax=Enterococcus sp. CWB-B31 TaxID=2885159 RepID=UPI001E37B7EE|nr:DUF4279 domain-containing protein [Enterococcus sp. CWB-B31]MCB5955154.1 DUF4279 domain-containing protein [Enterococcus sp. CWB-B31]
MEKSSVVIEVKIVGDILDTKVISEYLGVTPTYQFTKGEYYQKKTMPVSKVRSFSLWSKEIGKEYTYDSSDLLDKAIKFISEKKVGLSKVAEKYDCEVTMEIVLGIEEGIVPSVVIEPNQSLILGELNITVDVDIYAYSL